MKASQGLLYLAVALLGSAQVASAQAVAGSPDPLLLVRPVGGTSETRASLEARLAERPNDPDILRQLAAADAAAGDFKAALDHIDRALALAPQDLDLQLARANILLWSGERKAASRQGSAIAAVAPNYPELAAFQVALRRSRAEDRVRIGRMSFSQGISAANFTDGSRRTWFTQDAALTIKLGQARYSLVQIEHEDREVTDTRISTRFERQLDGGHIFLAGTVTPDPDFRESWSIAGGGEARLGKRTIGTLDVRYAAYRNVNVSTIRGGLRQSLGRDLSVSGSVINLLGGGENYRVGGAIRFDYTDEGKVGYFLSASSYPDTEGSETRQATGIAGGAVIPLSEALTLRVTSEFEQRKDSYRRYAANVGLTWRFDGR